MEQTLPLAQKLYLLGIHPEKGGIVSSSYSKIDYALIGGLLMELYAAKKIRFEGKKVVVLSDKAECDVHRYMLLKMKKAKRLKTISTWMQKFYYALRYIRTEIQGGLVDKRLIGLRAKHFLFFKWKKPYLLNKRAVFQLQTHIENRIFKGTSDEDELIFLAFIEPAGLLPRLFPDRKKRKQAKLRLKKLMADNQVSLAVSNAFSSAQAIAATVAITAATSSTTS